MPTVTIRKEYVNILKPFGGVERVVDEALKKYLIDTATSRIEKAKSEVKTFEKKYGLNFDAFKEKINDEKFIRNIERVNPTWEADYEEWEYWSREFDEWMERLKDILMKS